MDDVTLYFATQWQVALAAISLLLLAAEAGYRFARRRRSKIDEPDRGQVGTIQGAILGLLGLIAGFTYAMSVSRFDLRKQVLLDEANAIGTTYLRADFLPDPDRTKIRTLLRRYADARMEFFAADSDLGRAGRAEAEVRRLQREIWSGAVAVAARPPRQLTTNLFIQSLNDTIDLDAKELFALENRVPKAIWLMVYTVAVLALLTTGFACGLGNHRNLFSNLVMPLAVATVLALAVDLDRPRQGLIRVGQQSLIRLRAGMDAPTMPPANP